MPILAGLYLFSCLASAGLPMLNGFVGEFLILLGTFVRHARWTAWAATGVILSAIYLLWSYQRVFFGTITHEKNSVLPDASLRERVILFTTAVAMLFMGVAPTLFTHRIEASSQQVLVQMQRRETYNAGPARAVPPVNSERAGQR
jgi:NADH-quinone oxidoreductase subunit M